MLPDENDGVKKDAAEGDKDPGLPDDIVLVIPVRSATGDLEITVQHRGVSIAEIPTLLALAKKQVEDKLGI